MIPNTTQTISILKVKEIQEVAFPIHIPEDAKDVDLVLDILLEDPRGYKYSKSLTYSLKGLIPPKLAYQYSFFDNGIGSSKGNGDHIIQNGETIALEVEIENKGKGDALDLLCGIVSQDHEIKLLHSKEDIGKIPPGEKIKAHFLFDVSPQFAAGNVSLDLDISEHYQQFGLKEKISFQGGIVRPDLSCTYRVDDSEKGNNNHILEAGEDARIVVKATNNGKGDAIDTIALLKTDHPLIEEKEKTVGFLPKSGGTKEVFFPIKIPENYKDDLINLEIMLKDPRGYTTQKAVSLAVKGIIPPDLRYTYQIGDDNKGYSLGNGNGKMENGEKIELRFSLKNYGQGKAREVSLSASCPDSQIRFERDQASLGELQPSDEREARLVFFVSPTYKKDPLPLTVTVSEKYGFGISKTEQIPVHLVAPLLSYSFQISDTGTPPNGYNGIIDSNEFIELKFRVKNIGDAKAEGVKLSFGKSSQMGVKINKGEDNLGNIEPGGELQGSLKFTVTQDFQGREITFPLLIAEQYQRGLNDALKLSFGSVQDLQAPEISIATLKDKTEVEQQQLKFQAEIFDDKALGKESDVQVRVNQHLLSASAGELKLTKVSSGNKDEKDKFLLDAVVPLEEGENSILITALDKFGNQGARRITVFHKRMQERAQKLNPPEIIIALPKPGDEIKQEKVKLVCVLKDDISIDKYQVKVNGQIVDVPAINREYRGVGGTKDLQMPNKELNLEGYLPLQSGQNVIEIFAYDSDSLQRSANVVVNKVAEFGDIWALVVGISKYADPNNNLKYADTDAQAFFDFFTTRMGNRMKQAHTLLLLNEKATLKGIKEGLRIFLQKALEKDLVLIYFAGHGEVEPGKMDEAYLVPHDAKYETLAVDGLSMVELDQIIKHRITAQKVVLIVDACHSGYLRGTEGKRGKNNNSAIDELLSKLAKSSGKVVLTATTKNEVAEESPVFGKEGKGHGGKFTYYLLEGLKGAADGLQEKDGIITLKEAFSYVNEKLPEETDNRQHPEIKGDPNEYENFPLIEVQ